MGTAKAMFAASGGGGSIGVSWIGRAFGAGCVFLRGTRRGSFLRLCSFEGRLYLWYSEREGRWQKAFGWLLVIDEHCGEAAEFERGRGSG